MKRFSSLRDSALFVCTGSLLVAGGALSILGRDGGATGLWYAATAVGVVYSAASIVTRAVRRQATVDVVALLALLGTVLVDEPFAGAVLALMLASGLLLEGRAQARARRELTLLMARAPRSARRYAGGAVEEVDVAEVAAGDRLLVGTGELAPVDGRLLGPAVLDESSLTGEARPVERSAGDTVRSGVVNAGGAFELRATAAAAESTYAGIVRLVQQAQSASSPYVRVADRIGLVFIPVTLLIAAMSWWLSGTLVRAVAVLVVATPCPLLLGVPIAVISGISRAARVGVVVKGGEALERLAAGRTLLLDKTGTLTAGRPELADLVAPGPIAADELLHLTASLDQVSAHPLASALVRAAGRRGVPTARPTAVDERPGYGVAGVVDGRPVRLGKPEWVPGRSVPAWAVRAERRAAVDGSSAVFAAVDGEPAGVLLFEDPIRPDAAAMVRELRAAGIARVVLLTGDRVDAAQRVGRLVGVDEVVAGCDPAAKVAKVVAESAARPTIMVGDGVNDAPALAAAGVGVALAASGATASSEAADVVLTVDRVSALADAIHIAHRARRIATIAAGVGMGLSAAAMVVAAGGLLAPAAGAVTQEAIDVLAIGIALLALAAPRRPGRRLTPAETDDLVRIQREHDALTATVDRIADVADRLDGAPEDLGAVRDLVAELETTLLPHERADEQRLAPLLVKRLGSPEAVTALHTAHAEIDQEVARLRRLVDDVDASGAEPSDRRELRRLLYEIHAVLRLHNSQETESVCSAMRAAGRALPLAVSGPGGGAGPATPR